MRILVTGGAGFIGSAITRRLIAEGHGVVVADNLSTGKRSNVPPEAEFVEVDLARPDCLDYLPTGGYDAVCHLAAQSSGPASADMPYLDLQANAASTLLLSRWCIEKSIPRFLYASSMVVYGNEAISPVSEQTHCSPISYYGVSKLTSENLLRLAAHEGLSVTSFRMFSVYGPGQNMDNLKQGMASIFMEYLLRGVEVPITGSLERYRDFIYIDDVVDAWMKALRMSATPSPVYNLGSGIPTTVRDLLSLLIRIMDMPSNHPIREQAGSASDTFGMFAAIQRAREELAWESATSLEAGLRTMYEWASKIRGV